MNDLKEKMSEAKADASPQLKRIVMRCKIKDHYEHAGRRGELLTTVATEQRLWAVVMWDGEDEPELYKADALLVEHTQTYWKNLTAESA